MSQRTKHVVVLSGAGISAESGIKTFRDAGGLWEGHRVEDVATPEAWDRNPQLVLDFYNQRLHGLQIVRGTQAAYSTYEDRKLRPYEDQWMAALRTLSASDLEQALHFVVIGLGSGKTIRADHLGVHPARKKITQLLEACPLKPHRNSN